MNPLQQKENNQSANKTIQKYIHMLTMDLFYHVRQDQNKTPMCTPPLAFSIYSCQTWRNDLSLYSNC